jgi:uncharacterized protein
VKLSLFVPEVRDLAAVMGAPGLLASGVPGVISDDECQGLLARHGAQLEALDHEPAPLLEWLRERGESPLLGRYFEALLGFWLTHLMGARRVAHSIPLLRGRQVVGELDFVFEDAAGASWHWEASVKFYLCTATTLEERRHTDAYLGTMTRDRLDRKLRVLLGRQLEAPRTEEGREALGRVGFESLSASRLFMKGALFYPYSGEWKKLPHPEQVSSGHLSGWWFKSLPPGEHWVELDRRRWLSPFLGRPGFEPLDRAAMESKINAHFAEARTALMLAGVVQGEDGLWREGSRGLVVHPGWPWRDASGSVSS